MRLNVRPLLVLALVCAAQAQDHHDWQSLTKLQTGGKIRLTLKAGSSTEVFQSFTPEDLKAGTPTAKNDDVLKVQRFGHEGWSRGKKAALGGTGGALVGAVGAVMGAGVGALLPVHGKELIYSAK
jgi:hypothetical protein